MTCPTCGNTGRILSIPPGWVIDGTFEPSRCDRCDGTGTARPGAWHDQAMVEAQQRKRDHVADGRMMVRGNEAAA